MIIAKDIKVSGTKHDNRNTLVIGSPGTGKTRNIILPSLLTETNSMVILDPKGELYDMTSNYLREKGYVVNKIDFSNPKESTVHYNPIAYISNEDDICKVAGILAKDEENINIDPFWNKSARILLQALIGYIMKYCPKHQRNLNSVRKLLSIPKYDNGEENTNEENGMEHKKRTATLNNIFKEVANRDPQSWPLQQYLAVSKSADKTWSSIVITALAEFSGILTPSIIDITNDDTINISSIGNTKTALFVCSSDIDRSKDILVELLFTQLFQELYKEADRNSEHCLKTPVTFYLDDYGCNLGINRFDCIAASSRGRGIAIVPILQSLDQLKNSAPTTYTAIINSMNNIVFLGGNDLETCRDISQRLDCPITDVLYKPKDEIYVFRQGEKPVATKCFDVTQLPQYSKIKISQNKSVSKDMSICA